MALTAVSNDGSFRVSIRPSADPSPLNEYFTAEIEVRPVRPGFAPTSIAFDAVMPGHDHGMTTDTQVKALGDGRFQVEGILLHMAGLWELHVDATDEDGVIERAQVMTRVCEGPCGS
jgi:hypothetical protein